MAQKINCRKTKLKNVFKILIERDGDTIDEARKRIRETKRLILESDPYEADEIILFNLGLEPDYLDQILEPWETELAFFDSLKF